MNKKAQTNTRYWLSVVAFGIVLGTGLQFAKAWTEPGAAPPGGNVAGPITTSNVGQTKSGRLILSSDLLTQRMYDLNNTGYYIDPASTSIMNSIRANIFYDQGNLGYYIDPASTSNTNRMQAQTVCLRGDCRTSWPAGGGGGGGDNLGNHSATRNLDMNYKSIDEVQSLYTRIIYDGNDANYYLNPDGDSKVKRLSVEGGVTSTFYYDWEDPRFYLNANGISVLHDIRPSIIYDRNNTNYYLNPDGDSKVKRLSAEGGVTSTFYYDWEDPRFYLNANGISVLHDIRPSIIYDRNNTNYYLNPDGDSKVKRLSAEGGVTSTSYYDLEDSNFYVDANRTSILNDLRVGIIYDRNNTGYYVNPASTSRLSTLNVASDITATRLYANVFYDGSYYVNPTHTSTFNAIRATSVTETSDQKLKESIKPLSQTLEKITTLQGVSFEWKNKEEFGKGKKIGLIAQDVERIFPELVEEDEEGLKSVSYTSLVAPLIEAVKEQQEQIEILKEENRDIRGELKELQKK